MSGSRVILTANGKGGVGKTSCSCSLAAIIAQKGGSVLIANVNEQQPTATDWAATRKLNGVVPLVDVVNCAPARLRDMVGRADTLIIDSPGWLNDETVKIARWSHFVMIPTGPNLTADIRPTMVLMKTLKLSAGYEHWRMGAVLNRFTESSYAAEERAARDTFEEGGDLPVMKGVIRNMSGYNKALQEGRGMTETYSPSLNGDAHKVFDAVAAAVFASEAQLGKLAAKLARGKERHEQER